MEPRRAYRLRLPGGATLMLGPRTLVMGIVNVTPDSFSDGGEAFGTRAAVTRAARLVEEGADLLDLGGESTRPGAAEVPAAEQIRRVVPVIADVARRFPAVPVSIDTRSAEVARAALDAGAAIVNDVSGLRHDPALAGVVAASGAPAVVMHMRGTPADMRDRTSYVDVVADVLAELRAAIDAARASGVQHVIADPGLGFAKTAPQSMALLAATPRFAALDVPLLVGPSRKSFLALATRERGARPPGAAAPPATDRLHATVAAVALAAFLGAHIVRVHDVSACADAARLADAAREYGL